MRYHGTTRVKSLEYCGRFSRTLFHSPVDLFCNITIDKLFYTLYTPLFGSTLSPCQLAYSSITQHLCFPLSVQFLLFRFCLMPPSQLIIKPICLRESHFIPSSIYNLICHFPVISLCPQLHLNDRLQLYSHLSCLLHFISNSNLSYLPNQHSHYFHLHLLE